MPICNDLLKKNSYNRLPLKLLKNISYPTYQLFAIVDNHKTDAKTALKIAVLETMSWLRQRFRDFEIPIEIVFPEPDTYQNVNDEDIKSFRINEGYIVDVVYIKERGLWSFHLIEPDLGAEPGNEEQKRKPSPGRVFETNIAFKINNSQLECGFKTICSEPIGTTAACEVYRLAVVKAIARNKHLGLKQVIPIIEEPHLINSPGKIKQMKEYIKNRDRQIPFVIIAEHLNEINISKFNNEFFNLGDNKSNFLPTSSLKLDTNITLPFEIEDLVKKRMSYAQFAVLSHKYIDTYNKNVGCDYSISDGGLRIIHPIKFGLKSELFTYKDIISNQYKFCSFLEDKLQEYPKKKKIKYGNVKFLNEARIEEQQQIINMSNSKEEIIKASDIKLDIIKQDYINKNNMLNQEIESKDCKIMRLQEQIKEFNSNNEKWQAKIDEIQQENSIENQKLRSQLSRKNQMLERPTKPENVPEWVDKHFSDKLILHQKAKDLICDILSCEIDMNILCDALEFLAQEYRDETLDLINRDDRNNICAQKYNRPFDVAPSGGKSIENYPLEYKVKYAKGFNDKLVETPLDMHLRVGNDSENLLRIYFFFDSEKKLIVVGSLPKHLKTISDK